jgi:hypothetical protein
MPQEPRDESPNSPARVFGLGREVRRLREPLVVTEDTNVWEIYNRRAAELDKEMIKDWNDSLSTLLIFVSHIL